MRTTLAIVIFAAGCGSSSRSTPLAGGEPTTAGPAPVPARYAATELALPGSTSDSVGMDYLLFNPRTHTVWVPAGNTASVDVIDTASRKLTRIEGFATQEMERRGTMRTVGPSSATLGAGVVYIGNRGDFSVCAIDESTLARGACGKLDAMPDGIAYVASTKEVWVTTPRDKSIRILDATTLAQKARLEFDGEPEGFAVDPTHRRFFTNLEDKDKTLAIDLDSHRTVATWEPRCGEDGPHGLRFADPEAFLFVACSTKVEVLDAAHDGVILGSIDTGDGVDDFDYVAARHTLYVGAARAAKLTIALVSPKGALEPIASVETKEGARNGVVDATGTVYLAHSQGKELIVVAPAK